MDNRTTPEPNSRLARSLASLPVCGAETRLSLSPLAVDDYLKIIPLGLLDPPQHVLPTEHIFYRLKGENSDDGVNPATNPAAVVDVRALGNCVFWRLITPWALVKARIFTPVTT